MRGCLGNSCRPPLAHASQQNNLPAVLVWGAQAVLHHPVYNHHNLHLMWCREHKQCFTTTSQAKHMAQSHHTATPRGSVGLLGGSQLSKKWAVPLVSD